MSILEAIILGIVQGITEFLPVSSSGHLEVVKYFFDSKLSSSESIMITVLLHVATVFSTLIYFRKKIIELIKGCLRGKKKELQYFLKIIISMLPAAFAGIFFDSLITSFFSGNLNLISGCFVFTGFFLLISDRVKKFHKTRFNIVDALILGLSQAVAILPGISRSGFTVVTGIFLKVERKQVAEFSFLMVIPLILGKLFKDLLDIEKNIIYSVDYTVYLFGFLTAFLVGFFSCKFMVSLVSKARLSFFGYYCFFIGLITLIFFNFGR